MLPRPASTLTRRTFCLTSAAALTCAAARTQTAENVHFNVADYERPRILAAAAEALQRQPQTLTPAKGIPPNHYFSQDTEYFQADNKTYEHRPGYTNPAAFTAHHDALVQLNADVAACTAAWRLTAEPRYAQHALKHLRAWFLDPGTRMEPNLEHAACIPPSTDGTYRGVEEAITLAETVRAASFLCAYNGVATEDESTALHKWFSDFATWLNESKKGFIARETKDRTAICWTLVAAECARFARMESLSLDCSHRFRDKLLRLMSIDGEFMTELHRPDAYAASLFTLDCLSLACEVVSSPMDRVWDYNLPDGRGMRSAVSYLFPFIQSRAKWPYPADKEHFSDLPWRPSSLLFAGRAYTRPEYIAVWKAIPAEPKLPQLLRYMPSRQPALWTVRAPA